MKPLSLYIHIPWCIRKCPYCDFNSHKSPEIIPEKAYVSALIQDLEEDLKRFEKRPLQSIFIGGGTPSLFSAEAFEDLLTRLASLLFFEKNIEITLEANPGSVEAARFTDYRQLGINRLSLGIQSFNALHLKALGRIHDDTEAHRAIEIARAAGFTNLNLDLMYGLPNQSPAEALSDLNLAMVHQPEHLSWYQLTIEANTVFYKEKPALPMEDDIFLIEMQGLNLLEAKTYRRYEISAFSTTGHQSRHNLNYWMFGDYLGIGAGAHGKYSTDGRVWRTQKHKQPKTYLDPSKPYLAAIESVPESLLIFEFMLNTSRLEERIPLDLFCKETGLDLVLLLPKLQVAQQKNLIVLSETDWQVTGLGRRFTNDLQALFLP